MAFTSVVSVWLANVEADRDMKALQHAADLRQAVFQETFQDVLGGMSVINRLLANGGDLDRGQFESLVMPLAERHPYVQSFVFVRALPAAQRPIFETAMRRHLPGFVLTEEKGGRRVPAADRPGYHVIDYVAPMATNVTAVGLDIGRLPASMSAIERARVTGRPSASGMFTMTAIAGGHRAFAVLMPVSRKTSGQEESFAGFTGAVLRAWQLAEYTLQHAALAQQQDLMVNVYAELDGQRELVYRSHGSSLTDVRGDDASSWLDGGRTAAVSRSFETAGMQWQIMVARPAGAAVHAPVSAVLALGIGTALSVLLALYLQSLAVRQSYLAYANARLREDIAERERIAEALRASEERFQRLTDLSSDWYWEQDAELRFTMVSGDMLFDTIRTRDMLGKRRWELPVEIEEIDLAAHLALLQSRQPFSELEYRVRNEQGQVFWISVNGEPLFDKDGRFSGYRGTGKDVTDRKEAEQALRRSQKELRELAAHQARVKEDERKRIAREIHDDLGQNLLALRIDVTLLNEATRDSHPALHERGRTLLAQVDGAMRSVRAIINDLRPPVLDLGLQAALEWQVQQFRLRSGVACTLDVDDGSIDNLLDEEAATSVFRIVQESLTNVSRHAYASHVEIRLHGWYDRLCIEIADDGVGGFPGNMRKPRSFGLIGIRERVYNLGGEFRIDSVPGEGTTLSIVIPASRAQAALASAAAA